MPETRPAAGGGQGAAVIEGKELCQRLLVFPALVGQPPVLLGEVHFFQVEQQSVHAQGLLCLGVHAADLAADGRHVPGAVDIQIRLPQALAVFVQDLRDLADPGALVGEGDGQVQALGHLHPAGELPAVGQDHGQVPALFHRAGRVDLQDHHPFQGHYRQTAVLGHHVGDLVPHGGVDLLDPAGGREQDGVIGDLLWVFLQLPGDVVQVILDGGDGLAHGQGFHQGQGLALLHPVAVFDQIFGDLHALEHADGGALLLLERAAAGDGGAEGLSLHRRGQVAGLVVRLLLPGADQGRQVGHAPRHGQQQHHGDDVSDLAFLFHISLRNARRRWASSWRPC